MDREKKQFVMWTTIAGVLFLIVGVYDVFFLTTVKKSAFMIILELVAGLSFLINALMQWRKAQ